jgi:hypothetical protein
MIFWSGSGSGDPCLWLMDPDPDPGGPKTCGSGFGSGTLMQTIWMFEIRYRYKSIINNFSNEVQFFLGGHIFVFLATYCIRIKNLIHSTFETKIEKTVKRISSLFQTTCGHRVPWHCTGIDCISESYQKILDLNCFLKFLTYINRGENQPSLCDVCKKNKYVINSDTESLS